MFNQTKRLYKSKSKSKIFITILCIFGLLFSYSCSQVSDPNNTPPPTPNNDPDKDVLNGDLSTSSTKVIILANDGTTVSTTATIKFKNATGKLTKVEDSANQFELADLNYTGTTLTLTDSGKAKATEGELKTIKATFSLTKSANNVDLTATEQVVDIEIGKMAKSDNASILNAISTDLKGLGSIVISGGNFAFFNNTVEGETIKVDEENEFKEANVSTSSFKTDFETKFNDNKSKFSKITKIEFDSVEVDATDNKKATFKYKIFLIDVYEKTFETTPLSIILTIKTTNTTWTDDINNPAN